jgi:hypothetical protein
MGAGNQEEVEELVMMNDSKDHLIFGSRSLGAGNLTSIGAGFAFNQINHTLGSRVRRACLRSYRVHRLVHVDFSANGQEREEFLVCNEVNRIRLGLGF